MPERAGCKRKELCRGERWNRYKKMSDGNEVKLQTQHARLHFDGIIEQPVFCEPHPTCSASMAAQTGKLAAEMARIAVACPIDPLRPHIQLQTFLKSLATHPRLTPAAVRAAQALERNEMQKKVPLLPRRVPGCLTTFS